MNRNPHERRRGRGGRELSGAAFVNLGLSAPRQSPLQVEDLEAIAYRHHHRGFEEGKASRDADVATGRREAWDEGYREGFSDGRSSLLRDIDEMVGERVRMAVVTGEEAMAAAEGRDYGEMDPAQLVPLLSNQTRLLRYLLELHHIGFAQELPF